MTVVPHVGVGWGRAVGRGLWPRLPRFGPAWRRWGRYAVTSVVATAASEGTLLVLYGEHVLDASAAAVVASVVGTAPSYLMSRFWIWPEADRRRPGPQAVGYWLVGLVSLGLSSLLTGVAAANAPTGRTAHLAVVAVAYFGTYGLLWILKFAVYQRFLFRPVETTTAVQPQRPGPFDH
jgi:putative flippase GtrA